MHWERIILILLDTFLHLPLFEKILQIDKFGVIIIISKFESVSTLFSLKYSESIMA